jgi:acetylornithine deacetylase
MAMSELILPRAKEQSAHWTEAMEVHWPGLTATLTRMIRIASVSGNEAELVGFVADWARDHKFQTDVFETTQKPPADIIGASSASLPLQGRPTLVIRLPGRGGGRSLIFNAHSDVVAAPHPERWRFGGPWSGTMVDGRIYGRGACDAKGPLASGLLALLVLREVAPDGLPADVWLELVPGEENCVGLGTWTSVVRGYHAAAAVILEPTDGLPRCASRGGLRFRISLSGQAIHGTVKWLGRDALAALRVVLDALGRMEAEFQWMEPDPFFAAYPLQRPITVDRVEGGTGQGMICDAASAEGYFELLPRDDLDVWKERFAQALAGHGGKVNLRSDDIRVEFVEEYRGHITMPNHPLCQSAERIVTASEAGAAWAGWSAFNSGCEAALRWRLDSTPTVIWGPGHLTQAHAVDEFVELASVRETARQLALLAWDWTQPKESD